MPPWGRPPGDRGVRRYVEEAEDVYRFQELEGEDEKNGVLLEPSDQPDLDGKRFNPDELYFNDMDLRAWEARTAEIDGMAYGDEYYLEDEGYYDEAGRISMSPAEYEEFLFLRVLDKIRLARATGDQDVELTTEELDAYSRGMRPRAPAARPQPPRGRPVSAPMITGVVNGVASNAIMSTNSTSIASISDSSTRRRKSQQRTSIFAPRPKKDKDKQPSGRSRGTSNGSETINQSLQPPGFVVPGPNGPVYSPFTAYGRMRRDDSNVRSTGSPSRESRSASLNSRHAPTPPRVTPPREVPGAFPSHSPARYYRESTPPPARLSRPSSSQSRYSTQDNVESPNTRGRSSSIRQPVKLVPFPVTDYQHYTAEPYQYHVPGQPAASVQQSQPQYGRRVVAGQADANYTTMPRRVPVPAQRATAPVTGMQGSYSDPNLTHRASALGDEGSDGFGQGEVLVDVVPQTADNSSNVQRGKPSVKDLVNSANAKDGPRRSTGRARRKN